MMSKSMEELKAEATGLGLDFKGNISKANLAQLIEDYFESQSAGDLVEEVVEEIEEVKAEPEKAPKANVKKTIQQIAAERKKEAMKTKVVTLSSNDKRDNDLMSTAYLSAENQFFGVSKLVPLDIPVELEVCLIKVAKEAVITLHKDEIINGRRTGNKIPVRTRRYNISYEEN